jgi:hypothetical protein
MIFVPSFDKPLDMPYSSQTSKEVKKFLVKHPEIVARYVEKVEKIEQDPHKPL